MPTFFEGKVGRTVGCADEATTGTTALLELKPKIAWTQHKSIIMRMQISQQGNYQFLHTIGNDVYIYVFGDRIGQLVVSGLSVAADCTGATDLAPMGQDDGKHGFERIMHYYRKQRVAARKKPIRVTIGAETHIEGFLVGLTGDVIDHAARMIQYQLTMVTLPEKK